MHGSPKKKGDLRGFASTLCSIVYPKRRVIYGMVQTLFLRKTGVQCGTCSCTVSGKIGLRPSDIRPALVQFYARTKADFL